MATCIYCGKRVDRCEYTGAWIDLDVVDVDNPGVRCEAEDDPHRVESPQPVRVVVG